MVLNWLHVLYYKILVILFSLHNPSKLFAASADIKVKWERAKEIYTQF